MQSALWYTGQTGSKWKALAQLHTTVTGLVLTVNLIKTEAIKFSKESGHWYLVSSLIASFLCKPVFVLRIAFIREQEKSHSKRLWKILEGSVDRMGNQIDPSLASSNRSFHLLNDKITSITTYGICLIWKSLKVVNFNKLNQKLSQSPPSSKEHWDYT